MQLYRNTYFKRQANLPSFPIPLFKSTAATQEKRIFDILSPRTKSSVVSRALVH